MWLHLRPATDLTAHLRPLTHAAEIGTINSTPDSGTSFSSHARLLTSLTVCRARKTVNDVRSLHPHEKLALESGVEFKPMAPDFWSRFLQERVSESLQLF